MLTLQLVLTKEVDTKQEAQGIVTAIKEKLQGTGIMLSASYREMLDKPAPQ